MRVLALDDFLLVVHRSARSCHVAAAAAAATAAAAMPWDFLELLACGVGSRPRLPTLQMMAPRALVLVGLTG